MKTRFKDELMKLKSMTFREKRDYIWEYYKLPIIAAVFILFIAGSLVNTWFINPPKEEYLHIAWLAGYEAEDNLSRMATHMTDALVEDPEKQAVFISNFTLTEDPQYSMAVQSRLMAMVAAGELDIFLLDEAGVSEMAEADYIKPLDETLAELAVFDAALYQQILPSVKHVDYRASEDMPYERRAYGLSLKDSPLIESLGFFSDDIYLCIVVNTKKTTVTARAVLAFYV